MTTDSLTTNENDLKFAFRKLLRRAARTGRETGGWKMDHGILRSMAE